VRQPLPFADCLESGPDDIYVLIGCVESYTAIETTHIHNGPCAELPSGVVVGAEVGSERLEQRDDLNVSRECDLDHDQRSRDTILLSNYL
jgi:hypothetical protein